MVDDLFNFKECNFSFSKIRNEKITYKLNQLCLDKEELEILFNNIDKDKKNLEKLTKVSREFTDLLGFKKLSLENETESLLIKIEIL